MGPSYIRSCTNEAEAGALFDFEKFIGERLIVFVISNAV